MSGVKKARLVGTTFVGILGLTSALTKTPLFGRLRGKKAVKEVYPEIEIGATIPAVDVEEVMMATEDEVPSVPVSTDELFGSGRTVLFGLPGAFTPTCSDIHLPGFVKLAPKLRDLGVETIACVAENDRFVLSAWNETVAKCSGPNDAVTLLADADGDFTKRLGFREDMGFGLGVRCKRFALVLENGQVSYVAADPGMNVCDATSAETIVTFLGGNVDDPSPGPGAGAAVVLAAAALAAAYYVTQTNDQAGLLNSLPSF